jgi:hypothetical protein
MRIILRIYGIVIGLAIIRTVFMVHSFSSTNSLRALLADGVFGVISVSGWILTLAMGPFAAVQLWRLRESGRRTSLFLAVYGLLY